MSYEELMDRYGGVNSPPSSNTLKTILDSLKACSEAAKARSEIHDKGMRELARRMKELRERDRERDLAAEREAEEERKEKTKKARMKKEREDEHRPLAVGAHALARQDGGDNGTCHISFSYMSLLFVTSLGRPCSAQALVPSRVLYLQASSCYSKPDLFKKKRLI